MDSRGNQKELFQDEVFYSKVTSSQKEMQISREYLINWQKTINNFQANLFKGIDKKVITQGSLFNELEEPNIYKINPLKLSPLALSFWRWPNPPQKGPAIYFVMDRPENIDTHLLLYIGETIAADHRWKGKHDCKDYLEAYTEALVRSGLRNQLSIRFWLDAPKDTKARRKLELELIQHWLPPFNKETREVWNTSFTTKIN